MKAIAQLVWLAAYAAAIAFAPPIGAQEADVFPIQIKVTERSVALSARAHKECARQAFGLVAETWQKQILPTRFTTNSPSYPHKRRTDRYLARKEKLFERGKAKFRDVTNVLTGNMAEILTRPGIVRAFPTRASVSKVGTRYIDMRPYKARQPDKWAELCFLTPAERERLNAAWLGRYDLERERRLETKT